jgi:hypothetical protein
MLQIFSALSIVSPVIAGILFNKVKFSSAFLPIFTIFITQLAVTILRFNHLNNLWAINLFSIFTTIAFALYIIRSLKKVNIISLALSALLFAVIMALLNTYFGWFTLNKATYLSNNFVVIAISSWGLIHLLKRELSGQLLKQPIFWIIIGALFYFTLSTLIFSSLDIGLISNNEQLTFIYLYIHPYINIVANLLYTVAFLCHLKKPTSSSLS